jgi:multidrug efflux pump subunit AcrA (membrane-fusion protein)
MDERTRRIDEKVKPKPRRAPPAPSIDSRRGGRIRVGVGLIVLIALIIAANEFVPWPHAGRQAGGRQILPQPVGARTIGQGDVRVVVNAPEDDLPQIVPQLNAGTTLQVAAYDRANVKLLATGRVIALDSQIDTTTRTVKVGAQFDNPDYALLPNQFVNAQLLVRTLHDVITVPTAAIQRGAPGTFVYVINGDNTVSAR